MKSGFLITGLPRSRTAWLANLFSTGPVMCLHEPIVYVDGGLHGVRPYAENLSAEVVGVSDSTIPLFWDTYEREWMPCPIVVVERQLEVCVASLSTHTGVALDKLIPLLRELQERLVWLKREYPCLVVPFEDLNSLDVLQNIWTYCVPSVEFNVERASALQHLNVQQIPL